MLEHLDRMEHLRRVVGTCQSCGKKHPAVAAQLLHQYPCFSCGGEVVFEPDFRHDDEAFDSRIVKFSCGYCCEPLMEPMGRFVREYHCYNCGREIKIPNYEELKKQAEAAGCYKILVYRIDEQPDVETPLRLRQEHRPIWEFRIKPVSKW